VNFDDLKYCNLSEADEERNGLLDGDLLFVRTNGSRDLVGRCAIFAPIDQNQRVGFASYLIRVRVDSSKVLPRYLAYFLNSTNGRAEIDRRRRTSAGQFNINSENLRSIPFPVPILSEQERLVEQMGQQELQATQLMSELNRVTEEGRTMREAILRRAFAGEL
jgi:type I restriction enzyme S subunit